MKKLISLLLMVAILLLWIPCGLAIDIQPMWTYIKKVDNGLDIDSGTASMYSDVFANNTSVTKITVHNFLKRYQNGSWSNVSSWSQDTYGKSSEWSRTYSVSSGYNYRLTTYFYIYDGSNLLESTSVTSSQVYY